MPESETDSQSPLTSPRGRGASTRGRPPRRGRGGGAGAGDVTRGRGRPLIGGSRPALTPPSSPRDLSETESDREVSHNDDDDEVNSRSESPSVAGNRKRKHVGKKLSKSVAKVRHDDDTAVDDRDKTLDNESETEKMKTETKDFDSDDNVPLTHIVISQAKAEDTNVDDDTSAVKVDAVDAEMQKKVRDGRFCNLLVLQLSIFKLSVVVHAHVVSLLWPYQLHYMYD